MSSKKRTSDSSNKNKKLKKQDSSNSDTTDDSEDEIDEVTIDFSAFELAPCDFNGIQLLLHQLFLKTHLDLNELTNFIIDGQPDIGLVIKESEIEEPAENADGVNDDDTVYGLITAVSLSLNNQMQFISQLRNMFLELSKQHATDKTKVFISSLLNDPNYCVGFILNERYSNIPPVISVPSLNRLKSEIETNASSDSSFKFTHFIMICKLYKVPTKKKKNNAQNYDIFWSNAEEEVIDKVADARFEYGVLDESDSGLAGSWTEDDIELLPFRRVLVFSANKLDSIINEVSEIVK